jgi:nucleoside-diphosphate-sugar epimerase
MQGTNKIILSLMNGSLVPIPPYYVDVRDVAKTHVLALGLPRSPGALERRYIANGGHISWQETADHVRVSHPELRIPPNDRIPEMPGPVTSLDTSDTISDLKFGPGKFREPREAIDDAIAALQEVEKTWV